MRVAFLGLGNMGSPIARHLLRSGHELIVWNRNPERAATLKDAGAQVAATAAEAASAATIVFSMLMDDDSLTHVIYESGVIEAMSRGAIHVSLSTISVSLSDRLTSDHRGRGQEFIAAPVFGRPNIAEDGKLWIAAAGAQKSIDVVKPLLESFSRGLTVVGEKPSSAHALKLGGNFLITAMIASLSESMVYAEANGIDPALFLETVNSALFRSPLYESYGKVMIHPPETPAATIALGEKDTRLFREAAHSSGVDTPLGDTFAANFQRAIESGMKDADWAAGYYRLIRGLTRKDG